MAKFIKFYLDDETFGIDILVVQEIILPVEFKITKIPNAPEFLHGVINLRGMIVPFIDLRVKLGLEPAQLGEQSRTIICKIDETRVVGVLVDALSNVIEIPKGEIEPMRSETTIIDPLHILGVFKETDVLVVLVDIRSVLYSSNEKGGTVPALAGA